MCRIGAGSSVRPEVEYLTTDPPFLKSFHSVVSCVRPVFQNSALLSLSSNREESVFFALMLAQACENPTVNIGFISDFTAPAIRKVVPPNVVARSPSYMIGKMISEDLSLSAQNILR